MANSADPDQLALSEANWSGSTLFAKAEYIQFSRTRVKNVPLEKMAYANSADPDQTAPEKHSLIRVYTVCQQTTTA